MLAYALGYLSNVRFAHAMPAGQILFFFFLAMGELIDNHTDGGPDKAEAHHPI
jgi:hypothetical protein